MSFTYSNERKRGSHKGFSTALLTPIQIACMTKLTRTGELDTKNKKPFRTKEQKKVAKKNSFKDIDGANRTVAPVSYHTDKKNKSVVED